MKPILYLVKKEFLQVFRDPAMARIVFILPLIQLFVFGYAINMDLKNVRLAVLDDDHSVRSRRLVESFFASDLFVPAPPVTSPGELERFLVEDRADVSLWIPNGFAKKIDSRQPVEVGIAVNGTNASLAGQAGGYTNAIIRGQLMKMMEEMTAKFPRVKAKLRTVQPETRYFYNPELKSRTYMIPAIVVLIVTIISVLLTGMAVVREKEIGTLEQLMVSPITPFQLIAGKTIPFIVISFVDLAFAIAVAVLWFHIPLVGSLWLLAGVILIFLMVTLGVGLFVSTISRTQQQALFSVWFFLIYGILMSGFFFPIENMPDWAQVISYANPLRYMIEIVRGIFLKGSTIHDLLLPQLVPLTILGVITFSGAIFRFRKRIG